MGKKVTLKFLLPGGKVTPGPPLGPSLSPYKVNTGKIVAEINKLTKEYEGMPVPVEITIDLETKEYEIKVGTPPTSALLMKAANISQGPQRTVHEWVGNVSMKDVVEIAKKKIDVMPTNSLKAAVKSVLGTARATGIKVENKDPKEVTKEVDEGKWDAIIK
jgi:large subunit ribosomal protein L11